MKQAQAFACDVGTGLKSSFANVRNTLSQSRERMKKQYDKNTSKHHYQINDTVMLWNPPQKKGISRCFQPKWSGPWTITHLIGDVICKLIDLSGKVSPTVHVNQLKYVPPRSVHLANQSAIPKPPQEAPQENFCDIFADLNNVETNNCIDNTVHIEGARGGGNVADNFNATEHHDIDNEPARGAIIVDRDLQEGQLINDERNEQRAEQPIDDEQTVLPVDTQEDDNSIMNRNWCRVDISNILPNRTRSKSVT